MILTQQNGRLPSQWLETSQGSSTADSVLRRRKEPRFTLTDDFLVKPAINDAEPGCFARGYNISSNGLGILSKWLFRADSVVLVRRDLPEEEPWVRAAVVHCTQSVSGYKIGLRFEA